MTTSHPLLFSGPMVRAIIALFLLSGCECNDAHWEMETCFSHLDRIPSEQRAAYASRCTQLLEKVKRCEQ